MVKELVAARHASGLSQAALAHRLGRSPSYVAKVELAERRLDVIELLVILRVLGADPADFIKSLFLTIPDTLPR
ncbi:helix-turn-helix transcriptional regulator (plasmid) [Roseivivax marinus]|uniref:helix-turn-helix domain-containing protein n=1 Tax=Roseivivax marinus TaxID=1379903 RepID=UPI001F03A175|nr:helix-turn-helix transcriptional regulator [Roseivivax marinus]UMA67329.1 helix-turn-helix transcriptional regulator [Roseivivax marinus]